MKTEQIDQSIIQSVNLFNEAGKDFSVFDITLLIRDRINKKELEIDGLPREDVTDEHAAVIQNTQYISHYFVKSNFLTLFNAEKLNCEVKNRGKFIIYGSKSIQQSTINKPIITNKTKLFTKTEASSDYILKKSKQYLKNRQHGATIKKIHSRLKIKGLTCARIFSILGKELNYAKPENSKQYSKYFFKT